MTAPLYPLSSNSTELRDRIVWNDGDSSFHTDILARAVLNHKVKLDNCHVMEVNKEVDTFNSLTGRNLGLKAELRPLDMSWKIPDAYLQINLRKHFFSLLRKEIESMSDVSEGDAAIRIERLNHELALFEEYKMVDMIRTIIYIVDTFNENDVVWGTGRGSSCACYSLYLLGLHNVDSVKYDLHLSEFFR